MTTCGSCQMPPTCSWWALETPVTLARCGAAQVGSQAGGTTAAETRSDERSRLRLRRMCFFNTVRPEGNQISRRWQETEEGFSSARRSVIELPQISWSAVAVRVGQDRVRRPPRYPSYRSGPTGRHRRGRGRHEDPRIRKIP